MSTHVNSSICFWKKEIIWSPFRVSDKLNKLYLAVTVFCVLCCKIQENTLFKLWLKMFATPSKVVCHLICICSINPSIPAIHRSLNTKTRQPGDPATRQSVDLATNPSTGRPVNPATCQPGNPWTSRPRDSSTTDPLSWPHYIRW